MKSNPVFEKAVDVLATVSANEYNRMLYEARLKLGLEQNTPI